MVSMLMDADQVRALAELAGRAIADVENRGYATVTSFYELAEGVAQLAAEWERLKRIEEVARRTVEAHYELAGREVIEKGRLWDTLEDLRAALAVSSSAPSTPEDA
jgi:hypothetical protein